MHNNQEKQKVIFYIAELIKTGDLEIGSKLPAERELTDKLNVSRSSTREAISLLSGMGLIESRQGSGNYVVNNTVETIKKVVELMISLGSITQNDLIEYRRVLSSSVGRSLIERGLDDNHTNKLLKIIENMKNASDEEFCVLDRAFHLGLIDATGNALFTTVMEPVGELYLDMIINVIMSSADGDRNIRVQMHENILNSILEKDYDLCEKYMQEHYDYVEQRLKGE